jgi:hypothetical protein
MRPYLHDTICKITHTHQLQSSLIHQNKVTMRPYLHDEICKITHTHRSYLQVVDLAARGHWISSISIDGLENWFLDGNETTKLSEPTLLVCKSIRRVEGESIGKIMIIGNRMKNCSSWIQWSLDTGWNCSSWCQEVLSYLPWTRLRARGMSQGFFWQLCSRDEQPNHPLSQEFF